MQNFQYLLILYIMITFEKLVVTGVTTVLFLLILVIIVCRVVNTELVV
jgi:hypothetical protein